MAIALVASTSGVGTDSSVTSGSIDTTGANLLVMNIAVDGGATPTIADSKGNTWNALTSSTLTVKNLMYYSIPTSVGSGHTFSNTGASNYCSLEVETFSGVHATPVDQQNGATGTGSATLATGSVTPSEDGELVIAGLGFNASGTTITINGGFTKTHEVNFGGGNNYGSAMAYLIQTTATAANPTWTRGANVDAMAARIVTFKAAASSGPANLKTYSGLAKASVKTYNGLAIASWKTWNGLT